MRAVRNLLARAGEVVSLGALFITTPLFAQSNVVLRIMAANLTGNSQTYGAPQIRIFQGLKPDVVCIQEFNYGGNSSTEFRAFVDEAFGTNFSYFRETNAVYQIPNGIISRYPLLGAGQWTDTEVRNRGLAGGGIFVPRTIELLEVR